MKTSDVEPKRAVAYYRSAVQNGEAILRQEAQVKQYCAKHGIELIQELSDEGSSGLTLDRPGFMALIHGWVVNPESPGFTYVLMRDRSRIGRFSPGLLMMCEQFFADNGKKLLYVDEEAGSFKG